MESEFGESSNSIRLELISLENAGLLNSTLKGNKKLYYANTSYPLFSEINSMMKKFVGIDQIIEQITSRLGDLDAAYLIHNLAIGLDSKVIDLVLIGNNLNQESILSLIEKAESQLSRKIQYEILTREEMIRIHGEKAVLLIWKADGSLG